MLSAFYFDKVYNLFSRSRDNLLACGALLPRSIIVNIYIDVISNFIKFVYATWL